MKEEYGKSPSDHGAGARDLIFHEWRTMAPSRPVDLPTEVGLGRALGAMIVEDPSHLVCSSHLVCYAHERRNKDKKAESVGLRLDF